MKTREDYEKALKAVGEVIRTWDPYGLIAGGAPLDEYDSEIAKLATYVPKLRTEKEASEAISTVFTTAFGEREGFSVRQCRRIGRELFERLVQEGLAQRAV